MDLHVGLMLATTADADTGQVDPARVVEAAQRAEAAGFDGVYVGDHLLHPRPILESIVTLSAVAASTDRIALGPCVLLPALRGPLVLGKQIGTLAAFAPGRLRLGLGVGGEYPGEFRAADVPVHRRGRRMEAALTELRSLLSGHRPSEDLTFAPIAPVPFFLGGRKDAALRRAAEHGEGWVGYLLTAAGFAERRRFLLERTGSRPFGTGMLLPVQVDASGPGAASAAAAEAWSQLTDSSRPIPSTYFLAGRVEEVVDQTVRYVEAGCTEVILAPAMQGAGYLDQVDLLASEVLPRLRQVCADRSWPSTDP